MNHTMQNIGWARCALFATMSLGSSLICMSLRAQDIAVDKAKAIEIVNSTVIARKDIQRAIVKLSTECTKNERNPEAEGIEREYVIYIDGERCRIDQKWQRDAQTTYQAKTVLTPALYIADMGPLGPVEVVLDKSRIHDAARAMGQAIDPRLIGIQPSTLEALAGMGLSDVTIPADFNLTNVTEESIDGNAVARYEFIIVSPDNKVKTTYSVSIRPDASNNIVQVEVLGKFDSGTTRRNVISSQLTKFGEYWFPSETVYECFKDDKMTDREITRVADANFDPELGDKVFSLAGLELPVGRKIMRDGSVAEFWNGSKIVSGLTGELNANRIPTFRNVLIFNALILLALAVILIRRSNRKTGAGSCNATEPS